MKKNIMLLVLFSGVQLLANKGDGWKESSEDIRIPDVVLDGIREIECYKEEKTCDPCIIRINDAPDILKAKNAGVNVKGFVVKCGTPEACVGQTQKLLKMGIKSIDLGLYQINYKYHPKPKIAEYFNVEESREIANEILVDLVKTYGYSWETLGRYNYFNKEDNTRGRTYYTKLAKYVEKHSHGEIIPEDENGGVAKVVVENVEENKEKEEGEGESSWYFWK